MLIEAGLVDLLVGEVAGTPGALPLMSHALMETWNRREGRTLTVAGYAASGGIRGAVARSAETVYADAEEDQRHVLRDLVLRLVTAGAEGEPVRSRVPRRLLSTDLEHERVIDLLVSSRLVTSDAEVVEIAHEALARAWPRLQGWLDEDVEGQRILHHLSTAADSWDLLGRVDSELYRGARLSQALEWRARGNPSLTETEAAFLDAAEQAEESERRAAEVRARAQAREIRRQRGLLAGAVVLLVALLVAGGLALRQADRADTNAARALSAQTSAEARRAGARALATDDIDLSMLLAVAGVRMDDSTATRANLQAVLQQRPQLVRSVPYDGDPVTGLEVSPDGESLAVYDRRAGLRLSDTTTWETLAEVPRTGDSIPLQWLSPLAFSPDGALLAAGPAGVVRDPALLLDSRTLEPAPVRLPGIVSGPLRVVDVGFSANGHAVAATIQRMQRLDDGYWWPHATDLLVWDLRNDATTAVLAMRVELPDDGIFRWSRVALSPDGRTVYTSMPLSAYDVVSGSRLYARGRDVGGSGDRHNASNFFELNPAGTLLAVAEPPDRLHLLDARTGRLSRELYGHSDQVRSLRFSHDGKSLASSAWDRTAIIWDVATGTPRERLRVGGSATALAFSPDDTTLYSAGEDRAVRAWDLQGESQFLTTAVQPDSEGVGTLVPAPGGHHVLSWLGHGLRFYDVAEQRWTPVVGEELDHLFVTWSSDGTRVASVGDGFLQVWDPTTAEVVDEVHLEGVFAAVDFSTDDTSLALLSTDGDLSMRDAATLEPLGEPMRLDDPGGAVALGPAGRALVLTPGYVPDYTFEHVSRRWMLVDLDTGQELLRGEVDFNAGWLSMSPDGRHAAITGVTGELVVLDLATGRPVRPPTTAHATTVWGTDYSADGSRIVTTGRDGSVSLWDGPTGELLGSVVLPEKVASSANFGADDRTVLITTDYGGQYYWDTSTAHAVEFACRLAGRDLTEAEWRQAFDDRPWQPTCPADGPTG
jgi:WD40 repeat protein